MANPFKAHPRVKNTDGRTPTTTLGGKGGDKEGNTSLGGMTTNNSDDVIERMTTRGAAGFRNDIVKRNAKVRGKRGKRGKACD
jgi:hypothetical protein